MAEVLDLKTERVWRFSAIELSSLAIALATVTISITLWAVNTFQTKSDAREQRLELRREIDNVSSTVKDMESRINKIGDDVSYIRGRMEPKN